MPAPSTEPNPPSAAPIGPVAGDAALMLAALPVATALCSADGRLLGSNARMRILLGSGAPDVPIPDALGLGPDDAQTLREALAHGGSTKPLHGGSGAWWTASIEVLPGDRRVLRFWGLPHDVGTPALARAMEAVVDEDRAALGAAFRKSMAREGRYSHRYRVRTPAGEVRHLHSQWQIRTGDDGRPDRAIGVLFDDTETWDLARSQIEAVEQLTLAMDLGQLAVWRRDLRSGQVHLGSNAAGLLGLQDGQTPGVLQRFGELVHPDDLPLQQAALDQALAGAGPVDAEARVRRPDGGWRHLLTRRVLQRGADGQPLAVVGVALDVSDRLRQTREQTERVRQFELTAQAAGIGYWTLAGDSGQARWSEMTFRIHGLPTDAPPLTAQPWFRRFVHPGDRRRVASGLAGWVRSGRPTFEMEFRIVRADGEEIGRAHV